METPIVGLIQGMLAPGLMISACGLLLLGMNSKYSLVVNRIRLLNEDVAELFFTRSDRKIAPTIPDIEPLLADVPGLDYVGYLLYDRWELAPLPTHILEITKGKQVVFAYFSTGEIGPDRYTSVLPGAYDGTEFHAVVAVHPRVFFQFKEIQP